MTWPALVSMNGYGAYVWGAYLLTLAALGFEVLLLWRRSRTARDRQPMP